jgi:TRAP-type C4-dicarboxylate transport system substrate-binding protein
MRLVVLAVISLLAQLGLTSVQVAAAPAVLEKRMFCVFDPLGANGSLFGTAKDFATKALEWGYDLKLRPYTDEKIATDDFKAGQCDSVLVTGARARPFNKFASTVEAIGAIPSEAVMRNLVNMLATPKAAKYMSEGRYEVVGIMPAGPIYLFLRDRTVDSIEELSGKRIATIDYDEPSKRLVRHVGASIVPANSANFSGKFNNGSVDVAYAPAVAYKPLELYKGIGKKGGIVRYNLAYLDFQILVHKDRFTPEFGIQSRKTVAEAYDKVAEFVNRDTQAIPEKYWVDLNPADVDKYNLMLRDVRIALRDEGVYHPTMLKILRKLRCRENPANAECVEKLE